ncbi:uncharacterized protein LOC120177546 [Hibiscus syriacus]|uniref:uncharacterized protein LOC120177546 n=1 Tax=Hibiscus syriacus TaxID=106335 RepID=UPI00192477EC|nr:uncharacterized protein LOC120177546 [Hibiscus syriacus]
MNVLSNLLNITILKGVFKFHPKCRKISLTYLCFADDLIFCKGTIDYIIGVQSVLDVFYSFSGLKLNASKCEMYTAGINAEQCAFIQEVTGFKSGTLPVRYLGVPLVTRKIAVKDCQCLIEKIRAKLNSWANSHLSFAGRLQLIRSVLFSIANYWCRQMILPQSIIKKIEQLCSWFFLKGADLSASGARVSWRQVYLLKSEGDLLLAGTDNDLSTRGIWEELRIQGPKVSWHKLVWFPGRILK